MRQFLTLLFFILLGFTLFSCESDDTESDNKTNSRSIPKQETPITSKENKLISFHIQYYGELNCRGRDVVYLDMFNFNSSDIIKCKASGTKIVIGYFSSQWSSWYPDSGGDCLGHDEYTCQNKFDESMLGEDLPNWKGERFVNPNDPNVLQVMRDRIALAKQKGFDGVDVDNTDFYHFNTGFDLDKSDAIKYLNFFIKESHAMGLLFSLKNSMDIMHDISHADFYQNESCYKYNECKIYDEIDSPVFIISYKRKCPKHLYKNGYTILKKKMNQKDKKCEY